jgi:hypothetical protein
MTGAVCPACGVAVVPGYVRCPKCHGPLPRVARTTISQVGGTVVERTNKLPLYLLGGVAALLVVLVIRHYVVAAFEDYRTRSVAVRDRDGGVAIVEAAPPSTAPAVVPVAPPVAPTAAGPVRAEEVARALKSRLDKQRLWATVQVIGDRVDLRSAACSDAGLKLELDQSVAPFHAAGVTSLRCLEQSGAVVFARAL